jgi:thiol:disulfide interchange protein
MTDSEKRLKQLEVKLKGGNEGVVVNTISSLRGKEPCKGAIRLLTELFNSTTDPTNKKHVEEFMNDMKESSLRGEVIAEIRKEYRAETVKMLVSSCWQSGLDYSPYASDFALVFSSCDLETAIECFTVIEGCASLIPKKTKDHMIIILREHEENRTEEKSVLMLELVTVLS